MRALERTSRTPSRSKNVERLNLPLHQQARRSGGMHINDYPMYGMGHYSSAATSTDKR